MVRSYLILTMIFRDWSHFTDEKIEVQKLRGLVQIMPPKPTADPHSWVPEAIPCSEPASLSRLSGATDRVNMEVFTKTWSFWVGVTDWWVRKDNQLWSLMDLWNFCLKVRCKVENINEFKASWSGKTEDTMKGLGN